VHTSMSERMKCEEVNDGEDEGGMQESRALSFINLKVTAQLLKLSLYSSNLLIPSLTYLIHFILILQLFVFVAEELNFLSVTRF
jgi:hypothetical protein